MPIAILAAHVNSKGGEILAEVPDESQEKIVKAFRQKRRQRHYTKAYRSRLGKMLQLRLMRSSLPRGSHKHRERFNVNSRKKNASAAPAASALTPAQPEP